MDNNYLVDTHCHLHDRQWFTPDQAKEILRDAFDNNVKRIITIGTDPADSLHARDFANAHSGVFWTYGIHPESASRLSSVEVDASIAQLNSAGNGTYADHLGSAEIGISSTQPQAPHSLPIAIGEIGLDYHYEGYSREAQIRLFEQMLQLAQDLHLPVSLHIREAFADAWPVLDNFPKATGVVHSFTGSKRDLRQALERGFYIGINGLVTYTTPALPPLENMVLETDAPFLTPVPFRGTMNKSGYVRIIAAYLSEKMGVAEETIAEHTTKNARQLFHSGDALICQK